MRALTRAALYRPPFLAYEPAPFNEPTGPCANGRPGARFASWSNDGAEENNRKESAKMADENMSAAMGGAGAEAQSLPQANRPLCDPENPLTVRDLFNAGVHFGHQTKR